jgi:hypothetical protein
MKLRTVALTLALALAGSAFAATTTTETTVTRETPNGTVTKHVVKVHPHHRRVIKKVVVRRAPVHHRHVASVKPHHHKVSHPQRKVVVIKHS